MSGSTSSSAPQSGRDIAASATTSLASRRSVAAGGDRAAEAARRHVMSDLQGEGWRETDPFPRDEQDYVSMGFF
jgi:hypothetical protein